jgi:hypothetical protein
MRCVGVFAARADARRYDGRQSRGRRRHSGRHGDINFDNEESKQWK